MGRINKNGVVNTNLFSSAIQLSDGSLWQPICTHKINNEDGTYNMFNTTDNFTYTVFNSNNLWADFPLIDSVARFDSNYEFLVMQQTILNGDWSTYRFKQTVNPFTATWEDVKPGSSNVTWITGGSASYGGIYKLSSPTATASNYMCFANGSNGNWFGCGCKAYYQGGIPSICNTVAKGFQLVYIRISNNIYRQYNSISSATDFIEK